MNTAIDVKQLSVTLGNRHILHDINVSVPIGKITTLIGPNGCGKSTLLRSMIGYIHSPHECITIFDKPLQSYSQKHLARQMAFLPQVPNMPKDMTVEELVYCGRYPYQTWWKNTAKEDREIVDYALDITKTNHLREQLIPSLSGGERQRVWIAMALAQQPKLLVLDMRYAYMCLYSPAGRSREEVNGIMTAMLETNEMLDIDLEIDIDAMPTDSDSAPEIRSWILCTGGCTSRGGGSFCSWCC